MLRAMLGELGAT